MSQSSGKIQPDEPPVIDAALFTKMTSGSTLDREEGQAAHHNEKNEKEILSRGNNFLEKNISIQKD